MATLLIYHLDGNTALSALLHTRNVNAVYVSPADFGKPLGFFLGLPAPAAPESDEDKTRFFDPMLVFCGFSDEALDAFLRDLRTAGILVPLKAVLTEHNVFWSSARLWKELSAERRAFAAHTKK